jgi:hypothetical protein
MLFQSRCLIVALTLSAASCSAASLEKGSAAARTPTCRAQPARLSSSAPAAAWPVRTALTLIGVCRGERLWTALIRAGFLPRWQKTAATVL